MRMQPSSKRRAFTLIEVAAVIAVLLVLAAVTTLGIEQYLSWRDGQLAGDILRQVDAAQRLYFADNPSDSLAALTTAKLLPYMPTASWPTLPLSATIDCTTSPPRALLGGAPYDPSPSTTDGIWDVGK